MPITKKSGDVVLGGTLNGEGMLVVRVDKVGPDTVLASMIRQVEEAQGSKAPIQRLADHVSAYMVPAVLLVALIVLVAWRASGATTAVALHAAIAVLVVACPCSLGLATPMGIMVGTGRAAKRGILVRNATALERAHAMTVCIMDKTGTLTMGRPEVREFVNQSSLAEETLLRAVAGVERYSQHPLATALVRYAKERGLEPLPVQNFKAVTGQGAVADVRLDDGVILPLAIGSREMALRGQAGVGDSGDLAEERARGATVIFIGTEGRLLGQAAIADRPRPDAAAQIKRLGRMGIRVIMATGDNILTAGVVAKAMGIAEVHADLKPEGKVHLVESLQGSGEVVGMVGDGVNDAAALVKADVGFAIGSGSDVALASASLTLVKGELAKVVEALQISRETIKIIKQNLFWSFFYNGLAIPLAALGFLSPMLAAAAMVTSSVAVVTNSLRLRHKSLGL
jgi:Cu+-exporting ATPase